MRHRHDHGRPVPPRRGGRGFDRVRAVALAVLAGVALVACGGGEGSTGGSAGTDGRDSEKALLEFARCMRDHGVDMPDPSTEGGDRVFIGGGPAVDEATFEEAGKACRHLLEGTAREAPPALDPAVQDAFLEYARCMRGHGIDHPDPDEGGLRIRIGQGGLDPQSPEFKAADKACRYLLAKVDEKLERPEGRSP